MSKIIDLLEKTNIRERADDIWAFQKEGNLSYDQQKAIKRYSCLLHDAARIIDQALTLLKQQPTAGEWTKLMRERYKYSIDKKLCVSAKVFEEACDRLDRAEAINKVKDKRIAEFEAMVKAGGECCDILQERIDILSEDNTRAKKEG